MKHKYFLDGLTWMGTDEDDECWIDTSLYEGCTVTISYYEPRYTLWDPLRTWFKLDFGGFVRQR